MSVKSYNNILLLASVILLLSCNRVDNNYEVVSSLFIGVNKITKMDEIDYVGLSIHNEIFEVYIYDIDAECINNKIDSLSMLNNSKMSDNNRYLKWTHCPPAKSDTIDLPIMLTCNIKRQKIIEYVIKELQNESNWYIYKREYNNNLLFLYIIDTKTLFYVKWNI